MLKDLLEPGFPHIIKGSLNRIQINSEKIFSHKPLFLAKPIFPSKTILVKNKLSFSNISSKGILISFLIALFIY